MVIIDRFARWSLDRQKTYVRHPERRRRMLVLDLLIFVGTFASWALWPHVYGTWLGLILGVVVGLQLGRTALLDSQRAMAYRSGWLEGRAQMMSSLAEASRRGMRPDEWATAELQRDMSMLDGEL